MGPFYFSKCDFIRLQEQLIMTEIFNYVLLLYFYLSKVRLTTQELRTDIISVNRLTICSWGNLNGESQ